MSTAGGSGSRHVGWVSRIAVAGAVCLAALGCSERVTQRSEPTQLASSALDVPGLVAAYGFDEGTGTVLGDISGNANDGAVSGATWSTGVHGGALAFDGEDDWVTIPDADSLDLTTGMTLEAWVRPTARLGWETLLMKEGDSALAYALYVSENPFFNPAFQGAAVKIPGSGAGSGYNLPLNSWNHIAATYDASFVTLYVNGRRLSLNAFSAPLPVTAGALRIGGNDLFGEFLQGKVDDLRIYDRALSNEEILADMDEPVVSFTTESTPPTVAISSPSSGATLGGSVTISTTASDDQALAGVRFLIDDQWLGDQVTASPYSIDWDTGRVGNGSHTITAIARDVAGNTTTASTDVTIDNPTNGLVAAYAFEERAGAVVTDASSAHNDGTLVDGEWTTDGKYGGALSFDGVDDSVRIPDSPSLELTTGVTVEAWVRPAARGSWMGVVVKEFPDNTAYSLYSSNSDGYPGAWLHGQHDDFRVSEGFLQLPLDEWSHVAATFDGTTSALYINGQFAQSVLQPAILETSTDPMWLGANPPFGDWYNGLVDDVRIYSRPLTQPEIAFDMVTPVAGSSGGGDDCEGAPLDDGNPCTTDTCDPETGVTHTPVAAGTSCADGDACNGDETCDASGTCTSGTPVTCVATDQCHNAGTCDGATGTCSNPSKADGSTCSDGNACTQPDTCQAGTCTSGAAVVCTASDQCHDPGTCNTSTGACSNPAKANGSSCSDGNACTASDTCQAGSCTSGSAVVCAASDQCHDPGTCNTSTGACSDPPKANGSACSDGNACTQSDVCQSGVCSSGAPVVCVASDACHDAGVCNPGDGHCSSPAKPDGTSCSDGNVCNGVEVCSAGVCTGGAVAVVDDGNPCTVDTCDPVQGVRHVPAAIDDGNPCTDDSCDASNGVSHQQVPAGTVCGDNDNNICNGAHLCDEQGSCSADVVLPEIDDHNTCTVDACDPQGGTITHTLMDEGAACGDHCLGFGVCQLSNGGTLALCNVQTPPDFALDDGNVCTHDVCGSGGDQGTYEAHEPLPSGTDCSSPDGDLCVDASSCDGNGECVATGPADIDDGDACTQDLCISPGNPFDVPPGVYHLQMLPGTVCGDSDADPCNGILTCDDAGQCSRPRGTDDGNPCTTDACDTTGVHNDPAPAGTACDDGDACNGHETCDGQTFCLAGTPLDTADSNDCTEDGCQPDGTITHAPVAEGSSCETGNLCTADVCNATGVCVVGPPIDFGTFSCGTITCDPVSGAQVELFPIGTECAPATVCFAPRTCNFEGDCVFTDTLPVDDGNPCTDDSCDEALGMQHAPRPAGSSCDDGTFCNGSETCDAGGACNPGTTVEIDDHNPCTDDVCLESAFNLGFVQHAPRPNGANCSDGTLCNGSELCQAGQCEPGENLSVGTPCDTDGDFCNGEVCNGGGACAPGTGPVNPDDGNPCTDDHCDPTTGVSHVPRAAGSTCDTDTTVCNGSATCSTQAACVSAPPPVIDDNNPCTVDSCDPVLGARHIPLQPGTSCDDDATVCNGTGICSAQQVCVRSGPPVVDDGNPCTVDTCDAVTGVSHIVLADGASCADGNACNGVEICQAGACRAGVPVSTDDANPCTADACNPASGEVTHAAVANGTSCADSNLCNGTEVCTAGACGEGTPLNADDGNPCTDDSCDPAQGIRHVPRPEGTSCSDFDACNGIELCAAGGVCAPGVPVPIDHTNACRVGSCDPSTGVVTYASAPSGTLCFNDACASGSCDGSGECASTAVGSGDDGNDCTLEWCDPILGPQQKQCSTLNRTVGTALYDSMRWIFEPPMAIQVGVAPGTIVIERAVALRGRVLNRGGGPLPGVAITLLDHPELGRTTSQANGYFDLVVNGGGSLVMVYSKDGYRGLQRTVTTNWGDYAHVPDVVMVQPDPIVTAVDLSGASGLQVARSSVQSDADGTRQGTLLIPEGTQASMHFSDGTERPLNSMSVRITEFTVGSHGKEAMPGDLPAESKYTYAFDVEADEAVATNAERITFSTPVVYYVDNFLQFPAGTPVPLGSFERDENAWMCEENGVVLDVVGESGGRALVDVTGDGIADSGSALAAYGINDAEQQKLAELYDPGRTLWRVKLPHFSGWDANWGGGPPPDATPPNAPPPPPPDPPPPGCHGGGVPTPQPHASTIDCETQVLKESLPIAGTPYTLNYASNRVPGYVAGSRIEIPLSGSTVPASLLHIDLDVTIAGVTHHEQFPPLPNQATTFVWDGLDAFGRRVQGSQVASISVGFTYEYTYTKTDRFGYNGNGLEISVSTAAVPPPPGEFPTRCTGPSCASGSVPTRQEITTARRYYVTVGALDSLPLGMGGWTFDVHHVHDLAARRLDLGTGARIDAEIMPIGLGQVARANNIEGPFAVAPDGTIYIAGFNQVRRMGRNQPAVAFAGNGTTSAYGGDGLQANDPAVGLSAKDVAIGTDGSVYIADADNQVVRKVGPDNVIETVAGIPGVRNVTAEDGIATETALSNPHYIAVGTDGSLFIATDANILRVSSCGDIVRVAGLKMTSLVGTASNDPPSGVPATSVRIEPRWLAVAPDGTLYAVLTGGTGTDSDTIGTVVVKFVDGVMYRVAGNGSVGDNAYSDGDVATMADVRPTGISIDALGNLYISDIEGANSSSNFTRVATLTPEGKLVTVAGVRATPFAHNGSLEAADGVPATNALLDTSSLTQRFAVAGPDGIYLSNHGQQTTLFRLGVQLPHDTGASSIVGARDADTFYTLDASGRHLSTRHSLTGGELVHFSYDAGGRLSGITDEAGKATTIERDGSGNPLAIVGPFGQRTVVELDPNGYLSHVTDPAGGESFMTYQSGLLTSFTNARGLTSTMEYDTVGRLHVDADAAGGSQTLSRVQSGSNWQVTRSTALARTTDYATDVAENGKKTEIMLFPDGTKSTATLGTGRISTVEGPDGTVVTTTEIPDERLGLGAPIRMRTEVLPSGLTSTRATTRSYGNLNPSNFLDFLQRFDDTTINGKLWRTTYDTATRKFTFGSPQGRTSTRSIDALGRTTSTQLDGLAPVAFVYDTNGRLDHTTQGSGPLARTTGYGYVSTGSSAGYLQSITDALTVPTTYARDSLGRTLTETRAATTTAFAWDEVSNLATVTPPGKPTHSMGYTPVNLLASYAPPPASLPLASTSYTYDLDRMLRTETRPGGVQIVRTPDSAGRLDTVAIPGGQLDYDYYASNLPNAAGKTSDIRGPYGVDLHFTYDGKLAKSTTWSGDVAGSVAWNYNPDFNKILETVNGASGSAQAVFGYDADQLLTCASPTTCNPAGSDALKLTRNTAGLVSTIALGSTSETVTYNTFGELARQTATFSPSTPLVDITYDAAGVERDKLGRIVQKTEVIGGVTKVFHYTYDALRRLTDVTVNGTLEEHFEYDANGNRTLGYNATAGTTYTGTYDDQDRLLSYGPFDYTYTANGELETKTNRVTGEAWLFQYDALGNLLTVGLPNGDLVEYSVDGIGRRVGKKKNGVLLKQWIYRDALKPVAELDGAGALVSEFVYGSKSNVPDYVRRGGNTYRVVSDQLGSPRYVVNVSNASDVPFTATYTSFGDVTGTALDWMPFGFAGGICDGDTNVVRFGKRDFAPTIGRWISKEPLRFKAGRNFYAYAWNDPFNLFDPTGLDPTGAGGASGNGAEGAGNDPIQSDDPGAENSSWDACFDSCMDSQGADIAGDVILMCVPFFPIPKTSWEMSKTLGGGKGWTTWMSRAASALGLPANNALRTAGRYASTTATGAAVGAAAYYGTSAALCSAQCSQ